MPGITFPIATIGSGEHFIFELVHSPVTFRSLAIIEMPAIARNARISPQSAFMRDRRGIQIAGDHLSVRVVALPVFDEPLSERPRDEYPKDYGIRSLV